MAAQPTDEHLVARSRAGDGAALDALLLRHRPLVRERAATYFLVGGDREDLVQEGMIGLCLAVRDFDPSAGARFRTFAEVCVTRHVVSAVRADSRHKHRPLNEAVSLPDEPEVLTVAGHLDPAERLVARERLRVLADHVVAGLTGLEGDVLRLHLGGAAPAEIARRTGRPAKSVDNALQRARRKLDAVLAAWDAAA